MTANRDPQAAKQRLRRLLDELSDPADAAVAPPEVPSEAPESAADKARGYAAERPPHHGD